MHIDRELQKRWLVALKEIYPRAVDPDLIDDLQADLREDRENAEAALHYLREHELIVIFSYDAARVPYVPNVSKVKITAKGMDFLEDDGGLSAILGTVTVRLHADTIRDLIENRIAVSDTPPEEKQRMISTLKRLPEEGLKTLTNRLVNEGLSSAPGAWQALVQLLT